MSRAHVQLKKNADEYRKSRQRKILVAQTAETVSKLTNEEAANFHFNIRRALTVEGPTTPKELWYAVKGLFGMEVPYTACSDWTVAPFKFLSDVYFGKVTDVVALAGRGGGKTRLAAVQAWMFSTFRPNNRARHAAAILAQANVASDYLSQYRGDPVLESVFVKGGVTKNQALWKNGSVWSIVTGSMSGVSGQHPNQLYLDEIEFWDIEAIEQTFDVPVPFGDYPRLWQAFSTRQRSFGAMNWLMQEAPKRGIATYTWNIFETMKRCKTCAALDAEPHGTDASRSAVCILWEDCRGEKGTKATGWRDLADVQNTKRRHSRRQWEVQCLCEKPSSSGLVFSNFEHEYAPEGNYTRRTYDPNLPYYATHDPAEGKCSVLYLFQEDEYGRIYYFDELVQKVCPDVTATKEAFYAKTQSLGYGDPEFIIVDPHRSDAVHTWRSGSPYGEGMGRSYNAVVPNMKGIKSHSREGNIHLTIEYLRKDICDGSGVRKLFVNPVGCPGLIHAIREHHYPTDTEGNVLSDTPVADASKDFIDPLRYCSIYRRRHRSVGSGVSFI